MSEEQKQSAQEVFFHKLSEDYLAKISEVIYLYQVHKFGQSKKIYIKKELLRSFGMSADLARRIINREIKEKNTMQRCLDVFEDVLNLYDPTFQAPNRKALLMRKIYFYRTFVAQLDSLKPLLQK